MTSRTKNYHVYFDYKLYKEVLICTHMKIQKNEATGACGRYRYQYAEPFQD